VNVPKDDIGNETGGGKHEKRPRHIKQAKHMKGKPRVRMSKVADPQPASSSKKKGSRNPVDPDKLGGRQTRADKHKDLSVPPRTRRTKKVEQHLDSDKGSFKRTRGTTSPPEK
jgi:hypothetical protein